MRNISYGELLDNIGCGLVVFLEDDFTIPTTFNLNLVLYRSVRLNSVFFGRLYDSLHEIDITFADDLRSFVTAFKKGIHHISNWNLVIKDDIESALDAIKEQDEHLFKELTEIYKSLNEPENEDVKNVLFQYGVFANIPTNYSPFFEQFLCSETEWKPFVIFKSYLHEEKEDLKALISEYSTNGNIVCCLIDNDLSGENKAAAIVEDLEKISTENDIKTIGAVVTSKASYERINENIFIDYVNKDNMEHLKDSLLRSTYHYLLHKFKNNAVKGIEDAINNASTHRDIALYLSDIAQVEGMSNYEMFTQWLNGLCEYYMSQNDQLPRIVSISNLIERQEDEEGDIVSAPNFGDINTFESFDYSVNKYYQPVSPGDVFVGEDGKIYILVGQACDMAMGIDRDRRNGLCELVCATAETLPSAAKLKNDMQHMWINNFKCGGATMALKINYQKRYFIENEVLGLSSYSAEGQCEIALDFSDLSLQKPLLQQYQIGYYETLKKFFDSVMAIKTACPEAAETVLANGSIQWACRTIDFVHDGEKIHYPIKRICRLRDRYLLFLYKLFLEFRGRIPFNNANLARTTCSKVNFFIGDKSLDLYLDIMLTKTNEQLKKANVIIIKKSDVERVLQAFGFESPTVALDEEYSLGTNLLKIKFSVSKTMVLKRTGACRVQCDVERS